MLKSHCFFSLTYLVKWSQSKEIVRSSVIFLLSNFNLFVSLLNQVNQQAFSFVPLPSVPDKVLLYFHIPAHCVTCYKYILHYIINNCLISEVDAAADRTSSHPQDPTP